METMLHTQKTLSFSKRIVKYLPQTIRRRLPAEISVVSVSEKESRLLNRRYRGKNRAANVLSFLYPASETPRGSSKVLRQKKSGKEGGFDFAGRHAIDMDNRRFRGGVYDKEYGEIIVCPAVIRAEARKQKHTFRYQMTWYIVHGMIHLSGLHHEKSRRTAERVERLEKQILKRMGSV